MTLDALAANHGADEYALHVFCDGPKPEDDPETIRAVRQTAKKNRGFKKLQVWEQSENKGLAASIVEGVTTLVESAGEVVVLEDDIVTAPFFLDYVNTGLSTYRDCDRVAAIHGYLWPVKKPLPETFFLQGTDCWGWATWKRAWEKYRADGEELLKQIVSRGLMRSFDLNNAFPNTRMLARQVLGKNNSWAIRWHASAFLAGMVTLYPGRSLVQNIGHDETATHGRASSRYDVSLSETPIRVEPQSPVPNPRALRTIARHLRDTEPPRSRKRVLLEKLRFRLSGGAPRSVDF